MFSISLEFEILKKVGKGDLLGLILAIVMRF